MTHREDIAIITTVNVYLTFNGNCEEAFNFYKSVFGGEFHYVGRYKDMPPQEGAPPLSEELAEKIMHMSLPISEQTVLAGSDSGGMWGGEVQMGSNVSITVNTKDVDKAVAIFNGLADGGEVTMPLEKTFWGAYLGMVTDKFGIYWMVNCPLGGQEQE